MIPIRPDSIATQIHVNFVLKYERKFSPIFLRLQEDEGFGSLACISQPGSGG